MKKKLFVLACVAMMVFTLAGCGKSDDSSKGSKGNKKSNLSAEEEAVVGRYMLYEYNWNPSEFVDLYSDGTGYTTYQNIFSENVYTPVKWEYNKEDDQVYIYFPRFADDYGDDNDGTGYYTVQYEFCKTNGEELVDGHYLLYVYTDNKVGDTVDTYAVFGPNTSGAWLKMGTPGITKPYGFWESEDNESTKHYEDYKAIWPEFEEEFKDGKKYSDVDDNAFKSLDKATKGDYMDYRDSVKGE